MSEELRAEVKTAIKRHNPSADTLRDLAADLETLAEKYEYTDEIL